MHVFKIINKIVFTSAFLMFFGLSISTPALALPPSYEQNFAKHLTDGKPNAQGEIQNVFNLGIDKNATIMQNVRKLFYPSISGDGGLIWDILRVIGFAILVLYIVYAGIQFVLHADDEGKIKQAQSSFLYIMIGAALFFGATWILGSALKIGNSGGSESLVANLQNNLLFQVLAFLKGAAFFIAIILMVSHGLRMIQALDAGDKFKEAGKGILNVVLALIFIKLIDYIYYIAQASDFKNRAIELIVEVSKGMAYILGGMFVIMLLVAGIKLMASNGEEGRFTEAKNTLFNVFLITIVIFLFLLILYQVFNEFS